MREKVGWQREERVVIAVEHPWKEEIKMREIRGKRQGNRGDEVSIGSGGKREGKIGLRLIWRVGKGIGFGPGSGVRMTWISPGECLGCLTSSASTHLGDTQFKAPHLRFIAEPWRSLRHLSRTPAEIGFQRSISVMT
ncbi:hypothetical protein B296_00059137 [Ensete ventricosum]|uniref:Uncharacterized protein n=1 Tax=Ensete ventricosum TaxID=4639 RepID=A0A426XJ22_ENSVE|nr:hypothetical protein B296_00059137 [Ensete ventricosum]